LYIFDLNGEKTTTINSSNPILLIKISAQRKEKFISTYDFEKIKIEWEDSKGIANVSDRELMQLTILNKLFTELKIEDLRNFKVDVQTNKFVLTANPKYTFGDPDQDVISQLSSITAMSLIKIDITPIANISTYDFEQIKIEWDTSIKIVDVGIKNAAQLLILDKLFTGLNIEDLSNFTVEVQTNKFVLTANLGYTFGAPNEGVISQLSSIAAMPLIKIDITPKPLITLPDFTKINIEYSNAGGDKNKIILALSKLFDGLDATTYEFVEINFLPLLNQFELKAKLGYTFGNPEEALVESLTSSAPIPTTIEHQQAKFENNKNTIKPGIAIYLSRDLMSITDQKARQDKLNEYYTLPTLDQGYILNITKVVASGDRETSLVVSFEIREAGTGKKIEFDISILGFDLDSLTQITVSENFTFTDADYESAKIILTNPVDQTKIIEGLSKAFIGVNEQNINLFKYTLNDANKKITLTANDSHTFGLINEKRIETLSSIAPIETDMSNEIKKFLSGESKLKDITSADAIKEINASSEKIEFIKKKYFNYLPTGLSSGYSYEYSSASSRGEKDLIIEFKITVTKDTTTTTATASIVITDFKALPTLNDQVNKFKDTYVSKDANITAQNVEKQINNIDDQSLKIEKLLQIADLPTNIDEGFKFEIIKIESFNPGDNEPTHLEVTLKISQINANFVEKMIRITDFKALPTLGEQALKLVDKSSPDNGITAIEVFTNINKLTNNDDKINLIKTYYSWPTFDEGFEFELLEVTIDETTPEWNSLIIGYRLTNLIVGTNIESEREGNFKITNFKVYKNILAQKEKFKGAVTLKPDQVSLQPFMELASLITSGASAQE
ncbi:MAG: hypothetical protein KFW07_04315, partial [Mycoplasmataceae bacterium]|nr:hypothetical protein [Mycoplasmataceae bacterium]